MDLQQSIITALSHLKYTFYWESECWKTPCSELLSVWRENGTELTFFRTFMANIFPAWLPCTFRTWKTWRGRRKKNVHGDHWWMFRHVAVTNIHTYTHTLTHLSVSSFPEHSKQFKAVGSDSLAVPVHAGAGELHFLRLNAFKYMLSSFQFINLLNIYIDFLNSKWSIIIHSICSINQETVRDTYGSVSATVKLHTSSCKKKNKQQIFN